MLNQVNSLVETELALRVGYYIGVYSQQKKKQNKKKINIFNKESIIHTYKFGKFDRSPNSVGIGPVSWLEKRYLFEEEKKKRKKKEFNIFWRIRVI